MRSIPHLPPQFPLIQFPDLHPQEDEQQFHVWADAIAAILDPHPQEDHGHPQMDIAQAQIEMGTYMGELMRSMV